jgi:hypothetical protein
MLQVKKNTAVSFDNLFFKHNAITDLQQVLEAPGKRSAIPRFFDHGTLDSLWCSLHLFNFDFHFFVPHSFHPYFTGAVCIEEFKDGLHILELMWCCNEIMFCRYANF